MGDTIKHLVRFIEQNILEEVNVKNLEVNFNYSERHIRRIFKNQTSLSIHPYITQRKMTYALFDLKTNIESVKDLHLKYGYNSHDSFSRAFKRTFKVSPKNFDKLNTDIIFKEVTPNILAPLILFDEDPKGTKYDFKHLYWTDEKNVITFKIIDINDFGTNHIDNLINYGFSTHNILKINTSSIDINNINSLIDPLFSIKFNNQTNDNLVIIYTKEINDYINLIINYIKEKNQMCLIINNDTISINEMESVLYHLSLLFNRATAIKHQEIKSLFEPTPSFFKKYDFESFSSIFSFDFESELKDYKKLIISISTKTLISVDLITAIVKHINDKENFKIKINPSINERQNSAFQFMIIAK